MAEQFDTPVRYNVAIEGPTVDLHTILKRGGRDVDIIGKLSPQQAREVAFALADGADKVEQWEGVRGESRRDVRVYPAVQHLIAANRGGRSA